MASNTRNVELREGALEKAVREGAVLDAASKALKDEADARRGEIRKLASKKFEDGEKSIKLAATGGRGATISRTEKVAPTEDEDLLGKARTAIREGTVRPFIVESTSISVTGPENRARALEVLAQAGLLDDCVVETSIAVDRTVYDEIVGSSDTTDRIRRSVAKCVEISANTPKVTFDGGGTELDGLSEALLTGGVQATRPAPAVSVSP